MNTRDDFTTKISVADLDLVKKNRHDAVDPFHAID